MPRNPAHIFLLLLLASACGVSKQQYESLQTAHNRLKNDSMLLEKRIRQLSDEREYLGTRSASMEQALTQRLQEKEDSLNQKGRLLLEKESSIKDMKARKEQEREAFETLAASVFGLFKDYPASDVNRSSNCTQIVTEISDRMLFVPGLSKVDHAKAQPFLEKIARAFEKNPDLSLMVVAHTDSVSNGREKFEDNWALGMAKANALVRLLVKEQHIPASRIFAATKAETVPLGKVNAGLGRNRVELVFYSTLLPCIHSKE